MIGYVSYCFVMGLPIGVKVPVHLWIRTVRPPFWYGQNLAKVSFEKKDIKCKDPGSNTVSVSSLTFLELV